MSNDAVKGLRRSSWSSDMFAGNTPTEAFASERPRLPAATSSLFLSAKGGGDIAVRSQTQLDLLLNFEADPKIASYSAFNVAPLMSDRRARAIGHLPFYLVHHETGTYVVTAAEREQLQGRRVKTALQWFDGLLALTRRWLLVLDPETLRQEPRRSTVSQLAEARFARVSVEDRRRVSDAVDRAGSLSMSECLSLITASRTPSAALFALVCDGTVAIDLGQAVSDETRVRSRLSHLSPIATN